MFQFASGFLSDLLQCFTDAAATLAYLNLLNWDHFLGWDLRRLCVGRLSLYLVSMIPDYVLNPKLLVNFLLHIEIQSKTKLASTFRSLFFKCFRQLQLPCMQIFILFETSQANIAFVIPKFIWKFLRMLRVLKERHLVFYEWCGLWQMMIMSSFHKNSHTRDLHNSNFFSWNSYEKLSSMTDFIIFYWITWNWRHSKEQPQRQQSCLKIGIYEQT